MRGSFINMCPKYWHSLLTSRVLDTFLGETNSQNKNKYINKAEVKSGIVIYLFVEKY